MYAPWPQSDTTRVLWAYDNERPAARGAPRMAYHDHRGVRSLYLMGGSPNTGDTAPPGVNHHWDVVAPNVSDTDEPGLFSENVLQNFAVTLRVANI